MSKNVTEWQAAQTAACFGLMFILAATEATMSRFPSPMLFGGKFFRLLSCPPLRYLDMNFCALSRGNNGK
jgi:hypothetical protein